MVDHISLLYDSVKLADIVKALESCPRDNQPRMRVGTQLKRNKAKLIEMLLKEGPYWVDKLYTIAADNNNEEMRKKQEKRTRHNDYVHNMRQNARNASLKGEFLDLPSQDEYLRCYSQFHEASSNTFLKHLICAVCARVLNALGAEFTTLNIVDVPNRDRLRPHRSHQAHTLTDGYLLEQKGCIENGSSKLINICRECLNDLQKNTNSPPKFSLANNLWIGPIPWQLECLTIAEHLLIARVYPRVFVVKLFPQDKSRYGLPDDQLQHALRGNVTSFELNSGAITQMINGNLMPQKPAVLASVLSVTFIGRGKVPNPAALKLFRVRREMIADALVWLKAHNTKYYGNIIIDPIRLAELPVDDVPHAIQVNMHHEEDASLINSESDGYIPDISIDDDPHTASLSPTDISSAPFSDEGQVVPLQFLGVMDNDMTKITTNEMMNWGIQNMWKRVEDSEWGYAIRYGAPVNTFGQPPKGQGPADPNRRNYWEIAFPLLYPYGIGGIESDRPVQLSFTEHIRWALRYHDRRFRYHNTFIFTAFGIQQRRQMLTSARVQMKRRDFESEAQTLGSITLDDLRRAAEEEDRHHQPSNPAIQMLKQRITATSRRVVGSDPARIQLRSQIRSTSLYLNQPTIWMTINPDDLHDPIAQIFAGEEIDMDDFIKTAGPNRISRSRNIARDPFAAAEFFNFTITSILDKLFGVTTTASRVHSNIGVLGKLKAYFGTVECQGRGTLHLHMLLWLHNTPPPRRLKELLQTDEFRSKVVAYLRSNVRSFLSELATPAQVIENIPDAEVAYSRSPDPALPIETLLDQLKELEIKVVRAKQIHTCVEEKCLRYDRHGKQVCKRRAPWEVSESDTVNSDGTYSTKRLLAFLNGYCPAIAETIKCNQDIKLLLHGPETKHVIFYVTKYMAKPEGRTHNASSLLADGLINHYQEDPNVKDLKERQHDLILRAVNVLNREQEVPAPLAVTYLMGWGDVYHSHQYANIYWGSFASYINRIYPDLRIFLPEDLTTNSHEGVDINTSTETTRSRAELLSTEEENGQHNDNGPEEIVLQLDNAGRICQKSQVDDYIYRGEEANTYNVLDYFVCTYEQSVSQRKPGNPVVENTVEDLGIEGSDGSTPRVAMFRGRPPHRRISYNHTHPRGKTHIRVIRPIDHNHLPNMIGPRFPRRSDPTQANIYAASVLTLLKPWRSPSDLKHPEQTWSDALESFLSIAGDRILDILDNLEHEHESQAAAEAKQSSSYTSEGVDIQTEECFAMQESDSNHGPHRISSLEITQEMVDKAQRDMEDQRDVVYGGQAVQIGRSKGVFDAPQSPTISCSDRATANDLDMLKHWQSLLNIEAPITHEEDCITGNRLNLITDIGNVEPLLPQQSSSNNSHEETAVEPLHERPIDPITPSSLLPDQQRAFGIIRWHLMRTLYAQNYDSTFHVPQLFMLLVGEGGTGKSKVIQTITEEFKRQRVAHILMKSAYTGCAASLIEGKTTHHIGRISVGNKNKTISDNAKKELTNIWRDIRYLIIDEYSMISKEFLAQLSRHISIGKLGTGSDIGASSFGGVNVVLCGDEHQFPPVAASSGGALYYPATSTRFRFSAEAGIGRTIYEKFDTVVILKQQVRVIDSEWRIFLNNVRRGCVKEQDISILNTLILTSPECIPTDFKSDKWKNCRLITPRNSVRTRWNDAAVKQHCRSTGHQLFICPAIDTCIDQGVRRPINLHEKFVSIKSATSGRNSRKGRRERNGLPDEVAIAIGLKVMVTLNVKTDLDVTNGARGVIVGMRLDPNEPPYDTTAPIVNLTRLPAYILVKLDRTRANALPGLSEGVIPIVPASKSYTIPMSVVQKDGHVEPVKRNVQRRQFPITPAYAFTDYRSQGQTISAAIIDIAEPPTGRGLNTHNVYVALSRCSGRDNIRILREFDRAILMRPLEFDLMKEDDRLEGLDAVTECWWNEIIH